MATKKKAVAKKSKSKKSPTKRLKKAVPPPDNPLLREQAYNPLNMGIAIDEEQMALMRMEAIKATREMPTSDTTEETPTPEDN